MNRLQQELQRLYGPLADRAADPAADADADAGADPDADADADHAASLADAPGRATVRAMVLELARPGDWARLSAAWAGAQTDLALPAPAIAVNGSDGCQLWFSLQTPVPVPRAAAFLDALRRRYLGDVAAARVRLLPALHSTPDAPPGPARPVPALQADSGQWSAFVTPDLVPMFSDEPWLVVPPNPDGQAKLLAPLKCITPADFDLAWQRLVPADRQAERPADLLAESTAVAPAQAPGTAAQAAQAVQAAVPPAGGLDPRRFLLDVMNNDGLDLALRIEAAKALLPGFDAARALRPDPGGDPRPA